MEKQALELLDDIQNSPAAKYILSALAGGALAGGTGMVTSMRGRERPGETDEERRNRILRNTLGLGVAGAAIGPGALYAMDRLSNTAPPDSRLATAIAKNTTPENRGLAGGAVGAAAAYELARRGTGRVASGLGKNLSALAGAGLGAGAGVMLPMGVEALSKPGWGEASGGALGAYGGLGLSRLLSGSRSRLARAKFLSPAGAIAGILSAYLARQPSGDN